MLAIDIPSPRVELSLHRFVSGLHRTDLVTDLRSQGPHTLIAPLDHAFDRLPWSFERLLSDDDLLEPRFDLFEYLVVRGQHAAQGEPRILTTVLGEALHLGGGAVVGRYGAARVLSTTTWEGHLVHVVDGCVFPTSVLDYEGADRLS